MSITSTGNSTNGYNATATGGFYVTDAGHKVSSTTSNGFQTNGFDHVTYLIEGKVDTPSGYDAIYSNDSYMTGIVAKSGKVTGTSDGFYFNSSANSPNIVNHGKIKVLDAAIECYADGLSVVNTGKVIGGNYGVYNSATASSVYNEGMIKGTSYGYYANVGTGVSSLQNDGTIKSDNFAIGLSSTTGTNQVVNDGKIISYGDTAIAGSSGVQNIFNSGEIVGDVLLFAGDDHYDGRGGGSVDGRIDGGDGFDNIRGSKENDKIKGGADNDTINGKSGNDKLKGGDGHDYIIAGKGNDKMDGGAGFDTFVFGTKEGKNTIRDWEDGIDHIDLQALGIASFAFLDNNAISSKNGHAVIDLEVVGGTGQIVVKNAAGDLDAGDFFL